MTLNRMSYRIYADERSDTLIARIRLLIISVVLKRNTLVNDNDSQKIIAFLLLCYALCKYLRISLLFILRSFVKYETLIRNDVTINFTYIYHYVYFLMYVLD